MALGLKCIVKLQRLILQTYINTVHIVMHHSGVWTQCIGVLYRTFDQCCIVITTAFEFFHDDASDLR